MFEERHDKYVKCDKYVKIKGKEIILTNKDWRTLLERFDPSNIQHLQNGYCYMNKPCICGNYKSSCSECPFGKLGINGCWKAIKTIEPKFLAIGMFAEMDSNYMKWRSRNCSKVKNMLTKIYVALREMKNYYEADAIPLKYTPYIPTHITFSPLIYGGVKTSRLTATEAIRLNHIILKIRSIENELDELKHQIKFYTEGEYKISKSLKKRLEDDKEYQIQAMKDMREERKKRGLPF